MKRAPNNPYAFPGVRMIDNGDGTWRTEYEDGMTLRDWFAGQAIMATNDEEYTPADYAKAAYAFADAMLAAREGGAS